MEQDAYWKTKELHGKKKPLDPVAFSYGLNFFRILNSKASNNNTYFLPLRPEYVYKIIYWSRRKRHEKVHHDSNYRNLKLI